MNRLFYLAGFSVVPLLAVAPFAMTVANTHEEPHPILAAMTVLLLITLPTSLGAMELVQAISPRRVLDVRAALRPSLMLVGLCSGGAMIITAGAWMLLVPDQRPSVVLGVGASTWTMIAVLGMKRRVEMHCIQCGYDLRQTPIPCPECGAADALETDH